MNIHRTRRNILTIDGELRRRLADTGGEYLPSIETKTPLPQIDRAHSYRHPDDWNRTETRTEREERQRVDRTAALAWIHVQYPYVAAWTHSNWLPEPHRRCEVSEFWWFWTTYGPGSGSYYEQVYDAPLGERTGPLVPVYIYLYHTVGFAVDWRGPYDQRTGWAKGPERIRVWRIGCEHQWRPPTEQDYAAGVPRPRMCLSVSVCKACGTVDVVDSSG